MKKRQLGKTGIEIAPLVFGGNVFGWTADESTSFALLDRFVEAGGNAIDTADIYSAFAPGNKGGESETVLGRWFAKSPRRRDKVVLITKVGGQYGAYPRGLTAPHILAGVEDSLRRLQTDHIDVYFSHFPDAHTPIEETLDAHDKLLKAGKVRSIGASNYSVVQLREALEAAKQGLPRYAVVQPEYNLCDRDFEGELRDLCVAEEMGVITYFSLAAGFLTGKYRTSDDIAGKARARAVGKYFNARGLRILAMLDEIALAHGVTNAEVALAWLMTRKGVTAPIASATSLAQLETLIAATRLTLSAADVAALDAASQPQG